MRVLITGGAGFIGSHLARRCVGRGDDVVVIDNLAATHSTALIDDLRADLHFVHGDIRCPEDLDRLPDGPYDRVFHLAASFANQLSVEHPLLDAATNVAGTTNVIRFVRRTGCGLLVYTGTSSSYGAAEIPLVEDAEMMPDTPYARHKLDAEKLVADSGQDFAVLRLFNVYGPGDIPGPYRNAIPNMLRALADAEPVRVFGSAATRDFNYVDDVVGHVIDAHVATGTTVNVGSGVETPITELATLLFRTLAIEGAPVHFDSPRAWDRVTRRVADVTRMHAAFGVRPRTDLDEGLRRTAEWLHASRYIARGPA